MAEGETAAAAAAAIGDTPNVYIIIIFASKEEFRLLFMTIYDSLNYHENHIVLTV